MTPRRQSRLNLNKTKATAAMQTVGLADRHMPYWQGMEEKLADFPGIWELLDDIGKQSKQPDDSFGRQPHAQQEEEEKGKLGNIINKEFEEKMKFFVYAKDHHYQNKGSHKSREKP